MNFCLRLALNVKKALPFAAHERARDLRAWLGGRSEADLMRDALGLRRRIEADLMRSRIWWSVQFERDFVRETPAARVGQNFLRLRVMAVVVVLLFGVGGLTGCATDKGFLMPLGGENSTAHGDAYAGEGMHFRKPMPYRPNPHPWQFYYKHCERGPSEHVSKTSYHCNEPF